MTQNSRDIEFMEQAIKQAEKALLEEEVPVGAVIVYEEKVIGTGYNSTRRLKDASAHAEILAMREAAEWLGHCYFDKCTIFVTLEPCVMCTGALILGKMNRLVYGAPEPKFGACGSVVNLVENTKFNHHFSVTRGILAEKCSALMQGFFRNLRSDNEKRKHPI